MKDGFSGSYLPEDVTFLLKPVALTPTPVEEKERLIQSGQCHYSEVLAPESPPGPAYMALFETCMKRCAARMAADVASLAKALAAEADPSLVLVSLARAGTPIGVLLRRALRHLGCEVPHYSVSIIRDRGIDDVAMQTILQRHPHASIRFVDGWTGKGAIARELNRAAAAYAPAGQCPADQLIVLADLAGVAGLAASGDDYLIPSSILNAIVSGLISRSVLNDQVVGHGDFHACVFYEEMRAADRSRDFVDTIDDLVQGALPTADAAQWGTAERATRERLSEQFMATTLERYQVEDRNRLKPGIGEATRAMLRRVPARLLVADPEHVDVQHLLLLAREKGVPTDICAEMPLRCATIIRRLGDQHAPWLGAQT